MIAGKFCLPVTVRQPLKIFPAEEFPDEAGESGSCQWQKSRGMETGWKFVRNPVRIRSRKRRGKFEDFLQKKY